MKYTAKAPANIAFIKYWGKKNEKLRIPMNSSVSMTLSNALTTTSVNFIDNLERDTIYINSTKTVGEENHRVVKHLNLIRDLAKIKSFARVDSKNNFPMSSGIASSASGFAALTLAATKAAGLNLSERELSVIARIGSGSAARSIPDGFVEWKTGNSSKDSYAYSLYQPDYWDICDLIAIVGEKGKDVSTTKGQTLVGTSPFYKSRVAGLEKKVSKIKLALKGKDFTLFGTILEDEAINMHAVMMTSKPVLFYWLPGTLEIILSVLQWRRSGEESYFTIDAGPNVHLICKKEKVSLFKKKLLTLKSVKKVIVNYPAKGARLV